MADSELLDEEEAYQSSSSSTLRLLDRMIERCRNTFMRQSKPFTYLPEEEVKKKNKELLNIELEILPTFKRRLESLQDSLGLQNDQRIHPNTNLESTYQSLKDLNGIYDTLHDAVEQVALHPPPAKTHARQYHAWKFFMTDLLTHEHWRLESADLFELLRYYRDYVRAWQQSTHRPTIKNYQLTFDNGQSIIKKTDHCARFIDTIILSFQLPDFNLLQIEWFKNIPKLDRLLVENSIMENWRAQSMGITPDRAIRLARKTVPLIKLMRTLFNKISNPRKKGSSSDLLTELNTITLNKLKVLPFWITLELQHLHDAISLIGCWARLSDREIARIQYLINNKISLCLNNFLVLLAFNVLPVDSDDLDPHSLEDNFQDWVLTWKSMWDSVICKFRDTLYYPEEEEEEYEYKEDEDKEDEEEEGEEGEEEEEYDGEDEEDEEGEGEEGEEQAKNNDDGDDDDDDDDEGA
ncbi:hypothetical protein MJO28_001277 [Puccinia striiformis f. sp. tritici]|uniref:Uncharacterized protein n=1 Tax=Puccinia striiformis f. sp. tritici TaxID=168172 RepID=A0ACC0EWJ8_9BASI|nr:hypothetical protein Pst134EB_004542 [Puccinia striiformis f. sp. tritici]KAI7960788.1 hypothetical protein MJO28_001277 [Puccinia striiformis f. sp. tritici]